MSVELQKIIDVMEQIAPPKFKEDYDNVGLMVGSRKAEISSVLITLDCTLEVIEEAIEKKCNLIIAHHPILFKKAASITEDNLLGRKLLKLIQNDINVYASHTNLDVTVGGINDIVVEMMGFTDARIMDVSNTMNNGSEVGIGRLVYLQNVMTLSELCSLVKSKLGIKSMRYSGEDQWQINRIAVINGSGEDYFGLAKKMKADCIITGDTSYHYVSDFYEEGIAVIDAGHFGTEWPAMKYFGLKLSDILKERKCDVELHISEKNNDPYIFI